MIPLHERNCADIPSGTAPLAEGAIRGLLAGLPGWAIEGGKLCKTFRFKNYYETTSFAAATAWISHRQDHHPEIVMHYNSLTIRYDTHTVGGLSENDFICAARVENLFS